MFSFFRRYSALRKVSILLILLVLLLQALVIQNKPAQAAVGFRISGRNLLDVNGNNFIMRGISHPHVWYTTQTSAFANIKAAGANTVRVVLSGGRWGPSTAADVTNVINLCKTNKLVCVLENHDTTGFGEDGAAVSLATSVNWWKSIQSALTGQENWVIVNIGNEPIGNNNAAQWTQSTIDAITALRAAGFQHTIMVDAPNWGQDWQFVMRDNAPAVKAADTTGNLIFSIHMYGVFNTAQEVQDYVASFVSRGLPLVIGEFGHNHSDGDPDENAIMQTAQTNGIGYIAWSWSGNGGGVEYLDMVTSFNPAQRTTWGTRVITGANGLSTTSVECTCYASGPVPTATRTNTPGGPTPVPPTRTNTPVVVPTNTQPPATGGLTVQIRAGGTDNNQQTAFTYAVRNTGTSAVSNISVRVYFTLDGSNAASNYTLEKYYDQSGVATVSAPTLASGTTYYFQVNYGTASLAANAQWEFQSALHLANWGTNFNGGNDHFHTGFAVGALPAALTNTNYLPAYINGTRAWGVEPGGTPNTPVAPTNTRTNTPIVPTATRTNTPVGPTATRTNTPVGPTPTRTNTVVVTRTLPPTATRTFTPVPPTTVPPTTVPPTTGPTTLKVQYKAADTATGDNQVKPHFRIVNSGSSAVALSELKIRYYFTRDNSAGLAFACDWSQVGCGNITAAFPALSPAATNADTYVELSFSAGAGSVAAGGNSGDIQARINHSDWTNFNESNDYSFDGTKINFADWDRVVLVRNGSVVWGIAPGGTGPTSVPPTTAPPTTVPTRTNTPQGPTPVPPTRTNTPQGPTPVPPTRTNTPVGPTPTNPPQGTHLDNPFVGANIYVNPDWSASVQASASRNPSLASKMNAVANVPTFVWMDTIAAVNGTNGYPRSLVGHLDAALAQGRNAIQIVVYNLPGRDCAALASNGELPLSQAGFDRYKTEYIDVIYNAISQAKYAGLRIIAVIEVDSLPNLVTNLSDPECSQANSQPYGYRPATQYALNKLAALSNFYAYIDIGHHGWLGWSSNFGPAVTLIGDTIKGTTKGVNSISGFVSASANYVAVDELYHTAQQSIGGQPVRSAKWHDWNDYIDERTYDIAWRNAMISAGFPSSIGMLIDTARNGWGGAARPAGPSTSTDLNTFVNESRIDRRIHKGNWCNQSGAGIGIRPTVAPAAGFDAFVWVKPPGESDGSSTLVPQGPDNPDGKGFDRMCDPTYGGNGLNGNSMSGALPGAPVSGRWFEAQFVELVTNAYPPLP